MTAAPRAQVLVVMGVSGTGKSTVAAALGEHLGWPVAEGDDLHPQHNIDKMSRSVPLDDCDRWPWLHAVAEWIRLRAAAGSGGVITCSALKLRYRDVLRAAHPGLVFLCLIGDEALLHTRMTQRDRHFMPAVLLESQLLAFEPLGPYELGLTVSSRQSIDTIVAATVEHLGG